MSLKGYKRKRLLSVLCHYSSICDEGLRKSTKYLSQDNRPLGHGLGPGPPVYERGAIITRPQSLILSYETGPNGLHIYIYIYMSHCSLTVYGQ
jgi:hypothetical protein